MFTTAVHSIKTKEELKETLRYFTNPNKVLSNPIYDKSFYKTLEKSRNSIKKYDIFDELFYRSYFKYDDLTNETIDELGINSPVGFHLYQRISKRNCNRRSILDWMEFCRIINRIRSIHFSIHT